MSNIINHSFITDVQDNYETAQTQQSYRLQHVTVQAHKVSLRRFHYRLLCVLALV